jgi:FkbM family methyltransferase
MVAEDVRRAHLVGAVAGLCVGGVVAFLVGRISALPESSFGPVVSPSASSTGTGSLPPLNSFPEVSFAQQGEDLVIKEIFAELGIAHATYLDVGAYDPIHGSNTYLFYALGSHGVVVEPNPLYASRLRATRPRDTVIEAGIGVTNETSADYFEFEEDQDNTFSREQADKLVRMGMPIKRTKKMPLASINDVLAAQFGGSAPSLLSIDTEGFDLAILRTLDFRRFRPPVICVETLELGTKRAIPEIGEFMSRQAYAVRGGTFVNTIFVDEQAIARAETSSPKGGDRDAGAR